MLAKAVRQIRISAGLSREAFAQTIGITKWILDCYEHGRTKVSTETWTRITEQYHDHLEKLGIPVEMPPEQEKVLPPTAVELKRIRLASGLTQQKFADSIGFTKSAIGNCEAGITNGSAQLWARVYEKYPDLCSGLGDVQVGNEQGNAKGHEELVTVIQSLDGREITPEEIIARVNEAAGGDVDSIYVRVEHNAAYWVKDDARGQVELW